MSRFRKLRWLLIAAAVVVLPAGASAWYLLRVEDIPESLPPVELDPAAIEIAATGDGPPLRVADLKGKTSFFVLVGAQTGKSAEGERLNRALNRWVYPDTTILIENPGAVLEDAHPKAAQWLQFVLGPAGQRQFALKGFRPIIDGVDTSGVPGAKDPANPFPTPQRLLTVAGDFESWPALSTRFFDEDEGYDILVTATGESLKRRYKYKEDRKSSAANVPADAEVNDLEKIVFRYATPYAKKLASVLFSEPDVAKAVGMTPEGFGVSGAGTAGSQDDDGDDPLGGALDD